MLSSYLKQELVYTVNIHRKLLSEVKVKQINILSRLDSVNDSSAVPGFFCSCESWVPAGFEDQSAVPTGPRLPLAGVVPEAHAAWASSTVFEALLRYH